MKFLIVGAGGCGGSIAAFLGKAGQDVTVIARGKHLEEIKEHGIKMLTPHMGDFTVEGIKAYDMEHYTDTPDVVFVCVKGYSMDDITPFLQRICDEHTIVLPILNIYGTGGRLQEKLPDSCVLDGCIYIAAQIEAPGTIKMNGNIFRIVYGARRGQEIRKELFEIKQVLEDAGITPVLSENIERDAFQKYAYVAPMAACGLYYDAPAALFQKAGEEREFVKAVMSEVDALATAMDIPFLVDIVKTNLDILDGLAPETSTSMQRDIWAGKSSELDGLVFEPVRMGKKYGVPTPKYEMIARKFGFEA